MVAPDPELQAAMPGMDDMHSLRMPLCCSTLSPEMDASKGAGKPVEKNRSEKCTEVGPGKIRIGPKRVLVGATFSVEHRLIGPMLTVLDPIIYQNCGSVKTCAMLLPAT